MNKQQTVVRSNWSSLVIMLSLICMGICSRPAASQTASDKQLYQDAAWSRMLRVWGIRNVEPGSITVSFDISPDGTASNIKLESTSGKTTTDRAFLKTIEQALPFPPLPSGAKKSVHVRCVMDLNLDRLCLDLKIPEFESVAQASNVIARPDVNVLAQTLRTGNMQAKQDALLDLQEMGSNAKAAVPAVVDLLKDKSEELRSRAFDVLESLGPSAEAAVPALIKLIGGANDADRPRAARVLGSIGPTAEQAVPVLVDSLDDQNSSLKDAAAEALAKMGAAASNSAINFMIGQFHEYVSFVPERLAKFGPAAVPALLKSIKDEDGNVMGHSVETFEKMADLARDGAFPQAAAAVPALIEVAHFPGGEARLKAIETLGKMGSAAKAAVPDLINILQHGDSETRYRAARALGEIGGNARAALPALKEALGDQSLRSEAKDAIRKIEGAGE